MSHTTVRAHTRRGYQVRAHTRRTELEAQRNKGMADILREALEGRRGQKHMVTIAAMDLGVTDATLYQWCREFGININEYRRPVASVANEREA